MITLARNIEGLFIQHTKTVKKIISNIIISISSCKQKERLSRKYERKSMKPINKWRAPKIKKLAT